MAHRRPPRWKRILFIALTLTLVSMLAPLALAVISGVVGILSVLAVLGYEPPSSLAPELRRPR